MRVRMLQQVSGTRNGEAWPGPTEEIDLPDAEARAAINGGVAEPSDAKHDMVLVPPAGVHTPGTVAYGDVNLVAAPTDAVADPEGARAALKTATEGGADKTVPSGSGVQNRDGSAQTEEQVDDAVKADEQTRQDLGMTQPAGASAKSTGTAPKSAPAAKSTK